MKPDAILTADWHIRSDTPKCRTDDYQKAQWRKIDFIMNLAKKHNCPILIAGDLGHKAIWPNPLLTKAIEHFISQMFIFVVPGQHDLPYHRLDKWIDGGLGVLDEAGSIEVPFENWYLTYQNIFACYCFPFGQSIDHFAKLHPDSKFKKIAIAHQMVIKDKELWPGQDASQTLFLQALSLLKKFPEYDLILTGDNHQTFVREYKGRVLVNPGSMMRMTAIQTDHRPCVFLWEAKTNEIEQVFLPIEKGVIDRKYIDNIQERDERIGAFVKRLKNHYKKGLSFEDNMEQHLKANRVRKTVKDKIWEAIG